MERRCIWCGKTFETNDVELDYCSVECFRADQEYECEKLRIDLFDQD